MKPKKSLGQNFLKDEKVLAKIISAANLTHKDKVIEIGPGEGFLTKELIKYTDKLICIEKDDELASKLDSRLRGNDKIKIINKDVLKVNLPEMVERNFGCHSERSVAESKPCLPAGRNLPNSTTGCISKKILRLCPSTDSAQDDKFSYKLIANIPYYITSPIIRLFLETKYPPTEMILMVQKEVAERICAKPGAMSILSVSVQYYAEPKILFYVDKKSFWPVPDVDSAVIKISEIKNKKLETKNKKNFFRVVRAGFSAKRKMLANNLANSLQIDKKDIEKILEKVNLRSTVRAQELTVEEWKELVELFKRIPPKSI